jgi:CTP synthase
MELEGHPFYMGTQFHPEYISRPENPEPIYVAFIAATLKNAEAGSRKPEKARALAR